MLKFIIYGFVGCGLVVVLVGFLFWRSFMNSFGDKVNAELSGHYWISGDKIRYSITDGASAAGSSDIEGADADTFEVIAKRAARDKNRAYYQNNVFDSIDRESMQSIWGAYLKDKDYVYYENDRLEFLDVNSKWLQIKGDSSHNWLVSQNGGAFRGVKANISDPQSLEVIDESDYSKDSKNVYFRSLKLEGADPLSFKIYKESGAVTFARDKTHVYIRDKVVPGADPITFSVVKDISAFKFYYKDANQVYYVSEKNNDFKIKIVDGAHASSFEKSSIDDNFFADRNYLYKWGEKIPNSDVKSLERLNYMFSKDKNHVYRMGRIVNGVDEQLLTKERVKELVDWEMLFMPTSSRTEREILLVAPEKIKQISENYTAYENKIFYRNSMISKADLDSFKPLNDFISVDKNNVYVQENILNGGSPDSFKFDESMKFSEPDENGFVHLL